MSRCEELRGSSGCRGPLGRLRRLGEHARRRHDLELAVRAASHDDLAREQLARVGTAGWIVMGHGLSTAAGGGGRSPRPGRRRASSSVSRSSSACGQRVERSRFSRSSSTALLVALLDDAADLGVDQLARGRRRPSADAGKSSGSSPGRAAPSTRPIASDMPQRPTIWRAMLRDLLEVGLGAGGDVAVDDLLGRAAAQRADDPAAQVLGVVAVAVGLGALEGDAQRPAARHDRDLAHRVGARLEHAEHGVAGLVVGGALALLLGRA